MDNFARRILAAAMAATITLGQTSAANMDDARWNEATANRNLAGLTKALLARDAAAAKPFFTFPIKRGGLLPDIPERNFETYFPKLFDEGFFKDFEPEARAKGTNLWERNWEWTCMTAPGLVSDDGKRVTEVVYESLWESRWRKELTDEEIGTLAPPLREGIANLMYSFRTDDGSWMGRLDKMADSTTRIALWSGGHALSGMPDITTRVKCIPEGSGGNLYWEPAGAAGPFARLWENHVGPANDPFPPLELELVADPGKTNTLPAVESLWKDLPAPNWRLQRHRRH